VTLSESGGKVYSLAPLHLRRLAGWCCTWLAGSCGSPERKQSCSISAPVYTQLPAIVVMETQYSVDSFVQWHNYWPRRPRNAGGGRGPMGAQNCGISFFTENL